MSSPTSERAPLLEPSSSSGPALATSSKAKLSLKRLPILYVLSFSVFLHALGAGLPATTILEILRVLSCRVWYMVNDPTSVPADGSDLPDSLCRITRPEGPDSYYIMSVTIMTVLQGIGHFISASLIGKFVNTLGRRKIYVILSALDCLTLAMFITFAMVSSSWALWGVAAGLLLGFLGGPLHLYLIGSMMIVDSVDATTRTSALSRLNGFLYLGMAPSFAIGGFITAHSSGRVCIWTAVAILAVHLIYVLLFVPETLRSRDGQSTTSFPLERSTSNEARKYTVLERFGLKVWGIFRSILGPIDTLRHVLPKKDAVDGHWNVRVTLLALGALFCYMGTMYVGQVVLLYSQTVLRFDAQAAGAMISTVQLCKTFYLLVILPYVLTYGRRFYMGPHAKQLAARVSSTSTSDAIEPQAPRPTIDLEAEFDNQAAITGLEPEPEREEAEQLEKEVSSHFDVRLITISWFWDALTLFLTGFAATKAQYIIILGLATLSAGYKAGLDSALAASVGHEDLGGVLSAIQMIQSLSEFLSPLLLGQIMAWSSGRIPALPFYVLSALFATAAVITLFVKDSDRYKGRIIL